MRHLSRVHRKGRACRRPRVLNARLRDELLNETLFTSLAQARAVLASWKDDYNNSRQHSALGNLTPTEYANRSDPGPQRGGRRYAMQRAPRPAPLLHQADGLKCHRDAPHCWMKRGAQTISSRSQGKLPYAREYICALQLARLTVLINVEQHP
ncbi:transposase [Bradyrhizobium sp. CSA207]|nr:transposase [Bradyrhizobium sp. CSA207]